MLSQEKQLSDFSPLYFEFADSLAGQSFIALLYVTSSIMDRRCKDKTFFWKLQHCELNFLFYLIFISLSGTKVNKRNELALVRFSPYLVLFSPNTFFVDEMGDFGTVRFEPIFLFQGKTILQLRNYLKSSSAVTADLTISEWAFRSIWACSIHPRQFIDE